MNKNLLSVLFQRNYLKCTTSTRPFNTLSPPENLVHSCAVEINANLHAVVRDVHTRVH